MKLDGMKCPSCGKVNTHAYQVDKVCIWDDEFYDGMKKNLEKIDLNLAVLIT